MFRTVIKWIAEAFAAKAEPVPARRIRAIVASSTDRAIACGWGGRNYWKG